MYFYENWVEWHCGLITPVMTLRVKSNDVLKIVAQVLLTVAVCTVFWAATSVSKTGNGFVCLLGDEYCLHTAAGNCESSDSISFYGNMNVIIVSASLSTSTDWKADGKKVVKGGPLKCPPLPMDKTSSNDELRKNITICCVAGAHLRPCQPLGCRAWITTSLLAKFSDVVSKQCN